MKWVKRGLWVALLGAVIAAVVLPGSAGTMWVGHTDLEVVFEVYDAATRRPIPGATVEVRSEGGFYEEREPREFTLSTGPDGNATYLCPGSMCFGAKGSGIDRFDVHHPWWWFSVGVPGYHTTDVEELASRKYRGLAKRDGPGRAKLVVAVPLTSRSN